MSVHDHKWPNAESEAHFNDMGKFVGNFPGEIKQSHVAVFVLAAAITAVILFFLCWVNSRVLKLWKFAKRRGMRGQAKREDENATFDNLISLFNERFVAAASAQTAIQMKNETNRNLNAADSTQNVGEGEITPKNGNNSNPPSSSGAKNAGDAAKAKENKVNHEK